MTDSPSSSECSFYEFFAGGGMARLGLGSGWRCLFANDFDAKKQAAYVANFGADHFHGGDVHALTASDMPGHADLAWASFPCQDLSLAGARGGLNEATRSGAFFGFWSLMTALDGEGRAPKLIVLENVSGLLTSRGGADFAALCALLAARGYRFGALEIDAARFTPQSRPRLFIVAQKAAIPLDPALVQPDDSLAIPSPFHTPAIRRALDSVAPEVRANWIWWRLPPPPARALALADVLDAYPPDHLWFSRQETEAMLAMMAPLHIQRVWALQETLRSAGGGAHFGTIYRRMRTVRGRKVQRAETRFDGLAGCLRTPGGGSSRQFVIHVAPDAVRVRRMSAREAARLMGLPDSYRLPDSETAGLYLAGDGVCVPAVAWLARCLLEKLLARAGERAAA